MNNTTLVGRLTADPELRYTENNKAVTNFTLAVNRRFKTEEQDADFIRIVVWGKQAENLTQYMRKGSQIGIKGEIRTRTYDNQGQTVYVTEVLATEVAFLEPKGSVIEEPKQEHQGTQFEQPRPEYNPFQEFGNTLEDNGLLF